MLFSFQVHLYVPVNKAMSPAAFVNINTTKKRSMQQRKEMNKRTNNEIHKNDTRIVEKKETTTRMKQREHNKDRKKNRTNTNKIEEMNL